MGMGAIVRPFACLIALETIPLKILKRVLAKLKKANIEVERLDWSEITTIPVRSFYIIYDSDRRRLSRIAKQIRTAPNPTASTASILWWCDERNSLDQWVDPQIDDAMTGKERIKELAVRFQIRIAQAAERAVKAERAIQNAKNETILRQREEFLGVCAHDLRSPIGLIKASVQLALKEPLSDLQRELLTRSERQSTNALALIEDLLDIMSYEQGLRPRYELVNLGTYLEGFHRDYRLQSDQKNIFFEYHNSIPHWNVMMDPDRVRQVLQNIFTNAVKFTNPGKHIYLKAESFNGRRRTDPPHPMVIITFQDEGRGISDKEMGEVFNRFSQGRVGKAEGRGLGLTVAKQIAQLHGGNVWANSREGQGTSFFILLPHTVSGIRARGARILVVDSEMNRWEGAAPSGVDLAVARDGVQAVTLASYYCPEVIVFAPHVEKLDVGETVKILKETGHPARRLLLCENDSDLFDPSLFHGIARLPLTSEKLGLT